MIDKISFSITDFGYGDSGKGAITAFMAEMTGAETVVRINGGPQAAHNVITQKNIHHCFSQIGSGSFSGSSTFLSRFMAINPISMLREGAVLQKKEVRGLGHPLSKVTISPFSPVVTPIHRSMNRLRELLRGDLRHGSCGIGYGETVSSVEALGGLALLAGDLRNIDICIHKLDILKGIKLEEAEKIAEGCYGAGIAEYIDDIKSIDIAELSRFYEVFATKGDVLIEEIAPQGTIIFEGAQGALIHGSKGFNPYVSHSDTSAKNAFTLSAEWKRPDPIKIGVIRGYSTRHGVGPFVTEDNSLSRILSAGEHNVHNEWQGKMRFGWPDLVAMRYGSLIMGKPDHIALTCMDKTLQIADEYFKVCIGYLAPSGSDIPDIFETDGYYKARKVISRILLPERDFPKEATDLLMECEPIYEGKDPEKIPFILERELGAPVSIITYGPKISDKKETVSLAELTKKQQPLI